MSGARTGPGPSQDESQRMILDYLQRRGFHKAASALEQEMRDSAAQASSSAGTGSAGAAAASSGTAQGTNKSSVSLNEFADRNAPSAPKQSTPQPPPAAPSSSAAAAAAPQPAAGPGQQQAQQQQGQLRKRPDQAVAAGQLLADPPSWEKGYAGLRTFVDNSLDIHRPELYPMLLPLFVHSYLDLVLVGYRDAADSFLQHFSVDHAAQDPHIVKMLSSIRNPAHVTESEEATKWRTERYIVRMSERGWGLLLGWLQGGGLAASIEGTEARGRDRVLAIINERIKVEAIPGPPLSLPEHGLASAVVKPKVLDLLKLGPQPPDPKILREIARVFPDALQNEQDIPEGVIQPGETLPYPVGLRTIDVQREVEKVREERKRIRLDPSAFEDAIGPLGDKRDIKGVKPSVCFFTIHDAGDTLNNVSFSDDQSCMAGAFSESHIRLWNLKNEPFSVLTTRDADDVKNAATLKAKRKRLDTTVKLVGHSGPVYGMSFDPVPGPSAPPRYLLSSSADSTVRLWSLDTLSCVMVYRGHREPVWDVAWGPRGIYFATASRDKTARLWNSGSESALRIFAGHTSDVNCVRFHSNSLYIATGSSDRTCRLWDVQKGVCVRVFVGHKGSVQSIALSPDGLHLASAATDNKIMLWSLATGQRIKTFSGHTSTVYSLAFSAESTIVVSGSDDQTVRVWDVFKPTREDRVSNLTLEQKRRISMGRKEDEGADKESDDLLATLLTKKTKVVNVTMTLRNLCLAAGPIEG